MNSLEFEEEITGMVEVEITNQLNSNDDSGNSKLENKVSYFLQSSELLLEFVDNRANATAKIAAREYIESDPGNYLKQFVTRLLPTGSSNDKYQGMQQDPNSAKSSTNFDPTRATQFHEAFENFESDAIMSTLRLMRTLVLIFSEIGADAGVDIPSARCATHRVGIG